MVQKNGRRSRALHEHTPPAKTIIAALKLRMYGGDAGLCGPGA